MAEVDGVAATLQTTPLWQHMTQLLATVLREQPADAVSALSTTSTRLRTGATLPPHTRSVYASTRVSGGGDGSNSAASARAMTSVAWAARAHEALTAAQHPTTAATSLDGGDGGGDDGYAVNDDNDDNDDMTGVTALGGRAEEQALLDAAAATAAAALPAQLDDVVATHRTLNDVGAGLPPSEALRVCVGLRALLRAAPLSRVRLWGRVRGTAQDYYIAEATLDAARVAEQREAAEAAGGGYANDDDDDDRNDDDDAYEGMQDDNDDDGDDDGSGHRRVAAVAAVLASHRAGVRRRRALREAAGTGANAYVYYVAHTHDTTRWTRLPDVLPHHLVAARRIRRPLTGNLDARVCSHPRFPGRERHYLRAQIARIHCACTLAPRGMYTTEGALPDVDDDDHVAAAERNGNNNSRSRHGDGKLASADATRALPVVVVPAYATELPLLPRDPASVHDDDDNDDDDDDADDGDDAAGNDGGDGDARRVWRRGYAGDALLQSRCWVHTAPTLLSCGRVTAPPPPPPFANDASDHDDDDNDNNNDAGRTRRRRSTTTTATATTTTAAATRAEGVSAADGVEYIHPFLCDVSCDAAMSFAGHSRAQFAAWCFRKAYAHESSTRSVYVARSLRWPGALVCATTTAGKPGAQCAVWYVGDGLKSIHDSDDNGLGDDGGSTMASSCWRHTTSPLLPPPRMCEYDEDALVLQRDCTAEEERAYAPPPPRHANDDDEDDDEVADDEDA